MNDGLLGHYRQMALDARATAANEVLAADAENERLRAEYLEELRDALPEELHGGIDEDSLRDTDMRHSPSPSVPVFIDGFPVLAVALISMRDGRKALLSSYVIEDGDEFTSDDEGLYRFKTVRRQHGDDLGMAIGEALLSAERMRELKPTLDGMNRLILANQARERERVEQLEKRDADSENWAEIALHDAVRHGWVCKDSVFTHIAYELHKIRKYLEAKHDDHDSE